METCRKSRVSGGSRGKCTQYWLTKTEEVHMEEEDVVGTYYSKEVEDGLTTWDYVRGNWATVCVWEHEFGVGESRWRTFACFPVMMFLCCNSSEKITCKESDVELWCEYHVLIPDDNEGHSKLASWED